MAVQCENCAALAKAIDAWLAREESNLSDELGAAGYVDPEESTQAALDLEDNLAAAMSEFTQQAADELAETGDLQQFTEEVWPEMQEGTSLGEDLQDIFLEWFKEYIPKLVNAYLTDTDMDLLHDMISDVTSAWMENWAPTLAGFLKANKTEGLSDLLGGALREGKGVNDTARKMVDEGIYSDLLSARRTALTEMLTAHSVAREEALQQSPTIDRKEWRHSGSRHNKPRKNHVAMDGTIVDKREPFELEGADGNMYYPQYPRDTSLPPGERVNCHCVHRGIVDDSTLGMSVERRRELQRQAIDRLNARGVLHKSEAPVIKRADDMLPPHMETPLTPTRRGFRNGDRLYQAADAVIDCRENGCVSRYIYDHQGRLALRIDSSDHGCRQLHPHGHGGAHYTQPLFDGNGELNGWTRNRALTARMVAACRDLLKDETGKVRG